MNFDTFLAVAALVGTFISYAILRFCDKNVYAKYNKTGNAVPMPHKKRSGHK
jgi:hypothetical protein